MKRRAALKLLATTPLIYTTMKLSALNQLTQDGSLSPKMPVLFLGHGSPMNAIEENSFVEGFRTVGSTLPRPAAIICISAHWETQGTWVTAMKHPRTIHDFGGFPKALYDVIYPAPGDPELAGDTRDLITSTRVGLDQQWGLDHGAWSVIKHLYPNADIPVLELSLDRFSTPEAHVRLAAELSILRRRGILIIGSGNMVHNLRLVAWNKMQGEPFAFDWAQEAHHKMTTMILDNNLNGLASYQKQGSAFDLAIPTPEHFLPLLYAMALKEDDDEVKLFNDEPIGGSLYMTSVKLG